MNIGRISIFSIMLIFTCLLASKYFVSNYMAPLNAQPQQRTIERQLLIKTNMTLLDKKMSTHVDSTSIITAKEIIAKYRESFEVLEDKTNKKIESLVKNIQKSNSPDSEFLTVEQYMIKGKALEQETDQAFYKLYHELINELKTFGYDEKHAREFEEEYIKKKEMLKSQIVLKAFAR